MKKTASKKPKDVATLVELSIRYLVFPEDQDVNIIEAINLIKSSLRFTKPSHRTVSLGTTGTAKILTEKTIQRYLKAQGAAR